jgi:hypothetical protein
MNVRVQNLAFPLIDSDYHEIYNVLWDVSNDVILWDV